MSILPPGGDAAVQARITDVMIRQARETITLHRAGIIHSCGLLGTLRGTPPPSPSPNPEGRFFSAGLSPPLRAPLPADRYYGVALGVEAAWPTPLPVSA